MSENDFHVILISKDGFSQDASPQIKTRYRPEDYRVLTTEAVISANEQRLSADSDQGKQESRNSDPRQRNYENENSETALQENELRIGDNFIQGIAKAKNVKPVTEKTDTKFSTYSTQGIKAVQSNNPSMQENKLTTGSNLDERIEGNESIDVKMQQMKSRFAADSRQGSEKIKNSNPSIQKSKLDSETISNRNFKGSETVSIDDSLEEFSKEADLLSEIGDSYAPKTVKVKQINDQEATLCWVEITTIEEKNGDIQSSHKEYAILADTNPNNADNIPAALQNELQDKNYTVWEPRNRAGKAYTYQTEKKIGDTIITKIKEFTCGSGPTFTKQYLRWPNSRRKRVEIKIKPYNQTNCKNDVGSGVARSLKVFDSDEVGEETDYNEIVGMPPLYANTNDSAEEKGDSRVTTDISPSDAGNQGKIETGTLQKERPEKIDKVIIVSPKEASDENKDSQKLEPKAGEQSQCSKPCDVETDRQTENSEKRPVKTVAILNMAIVDSNNPKHRIVDLSSRIELSWKKDEIVIADEKARQLCVDRFLKKILLCILRERNDPCKKKHKHRKQMVLVHRPLYQCSEVAPFYGSRTDGLIYGNSQWPQCLPMPCRFVNMVSRPSHARYYQPMHHNVDSVEYGEDGGY